MPYADNKGADQPAHPRCLIRTFVVRFLGSKRPVLAKAEISRLTSLGSSSGWFESYMVTNPEDRFSRDRAQLL